MIRAVVFDLDGTLVQTEILKALSYARAAEKLSPGLVTEEAVIEAFKSVVGLSRREVAETLVKKLGLEKAAAARMEEFNVTRPWQAFVQIRLKIYDSMLLNPKIISNHRCLHNLGLLKKIQKENYKTGLATMSRCEQAIRVLELLDLERCFDFIATRDDVEHSKPNPEIYRLVAKELNVSPKECLVIEDSLSGVKAALAAGMWCIAATTDFTHDSVHASGLLEERWIVGNPEDLEVIFRHMIAEHQD